MSSQKNTKNEIGKGLWQTVKAWNRELKGFLPADALKQFYIISYNIKNNYPKLANLLIFSSF